MKCCLNCLISFLWYFKRLSLPMCQAAVVRQTVRNQTLSLVEKSYINVPSPGLLGFIEKNNNRFVVVSTMTRKGSALVFGSDVFHRFKLDVLNGDLRDPKEAQMVPDGIFRFPAILVADGEFEDNESNGKLTVIDISDLSKPVSYDITSEPTAIASYAYEYGSPVWLSNEKFIVCRVSSLRDSPSVQWELLLYKVNIEDETKLWDGEIIEIDSCRFPITLYKNIWDSFDALYIANYLKGSLILMWTETNEGKPGDWLNPEELKNSVIDKDEAFMDIKLVDLNKDGKLDLLVSLASKRGEIRVYQIPISNDFRNLENYTAIKLATGFKPTTVGTCPNTLKTFLPSSGYGGKPWILFSGDSCGSAGYLFPESEDVDNWNYQVYWIIENAHWVTGVEAADLDRDGIMEIFVSLHKKNVIKVYSLGEGSLISNLSIIPYDAPNAEDDTGGSAVPPWVATQQLEVGSGASSIFVRFASCEHFPIFLIPLTIRLFI